MIAAIIKLVIAIVVAITVDRVLHQPGGEARLVADASRVVSTAVTLVRTIVNAAWAAAHH